jgi:hypothetical protein
LVNFEVQADEQARAWLEEHPTTHIRAITYDSYRCCGGARICTVAVRALTARKQEAADYVSTRLADGTQLLIDHRAARRLPARFGLTVRGVGPFKHLDLELSGDQWGDLLYT